MRERLHKILILSVAGAVIGGLLGALIGSAAVDVQQFLRATAVCAGIGSLVMFVSSFFLFARPYTEKKW